MGDNIETIEGLEKMDAFGLLLAAGLNVFLLAFFLYFCWQILKKLDQFLIKKRFLSLTKKLDMADYTVVFDSKGRPAAIIGKTDQTKIYFI